VILGFYAGKSHNLIGLGIFHGDLNFFDLHEKSLYPSNYEIFPHKILKSRTFTKSSILIVNGMLAFREQIQYPVRVLGDLKKCKCLLCLISRAVFSNNFDKNRLFIR
jgi:hypothetical protein